MIIKREVVINVMIDSATPLMVGDTCKIATGGKCLYGTYYGVNARGCLDFRAVVGKQNVNFALKAASIDAIEVVEHDEV